MFESSPGNSIRAHGTCRGCDEAGRALGRSLRARAGGRETDPPLARANGGSASSEVKRSMS
jgi:hypothetical protein